MGTIYWHTLHDDRHWREDWTTGRRQRLPIDRYFEIGRYKGEMVIVGD